MKQAREIAAKYQVVLRFDEESGEFYGRGVELPLCMGDGPTPDACVAHTRKAFVAVVATMLEKDQIPPAPQSGNIPRRSVQINVRLTPEEKSQLESASRREGFTGISDYVRSAALAASK